MFITKYFIPAMINNSKLSQDVTKNQNVSIKKPITLNIGNQTKISIQNSSIKPHSPLQGGAKDNNKDQSSVSQKQSDLKACIDKVLQEGKSSNENPNENLDQERNEVGSVLPTVNYSKLEVKDKVNKIFLNFAKYCEKEKDFFLSQQAFIKIIRQTQMLNEENLKLSDLDILLKTISPVSKKLNSEQFLNVIVKLAKKVLPQEFKQNAKKTLNYFISAFFEEYVHYIEDEKIALDDIISCNGKFTHKSIETLLSYPIDSRVKAIINNIYFGIKEIYSSYFHYELHSYKDTNKIEEGSMKDLIAFCKEFQICPYLISVDQLITYYKLVIQNNNLRSDGNYIVEEKKDMGKFFTLSKFCMLFIHLSLLSFTKNIQLNFSGSSLSDIEKLILFLEKLENSTGFQNFEKRSNKPHTGKLTLIPGQYILKLLDNQLYEESEMKGNNERGTMVCKGKGTKINTLIDKKLIKEFNSKITLDYNLTNLLNVNPEVIDLIEKHLDSLAECFLHFSRIGDKLNFNQMNLSSYLKFLRYADIIQEIPQNMKSQFYSIGKDLMSKTSKNVTKQSHFKELDNVCKIDHSSRPVLTEKEIIYKNKLAQLVNASNDGGKLSESDINVIFYSITGPKNFDNTSKNKSLFDKNKGFYVSFGENVKRSASFEKKLNKTKKATVPLKMDFYLFVKSFEQIAARLYPHSTLNDAVKELFEKKLIKAISKSQNISGSKEMNLAIQQINQPQVQEFLRKFEEVILPHYECYCDGDYQMSFSQFFDFYKDFSLFPDIINLVQLKNIFFTLSDFINEARNREKAKERDREVNRSYNGSETGNSPQVLKNNDYINFTLFLDSLAITAMFFNFNKSFTEIDKLLYLVERMNQSSGISKCQKRSGNTFSSSKDFLSFLLSIKEEYPNFYGGKGKDVRESDSMNFDEVYQDNDNEDY